MAELQDQLGGGNINVTAGTGFNTKGDVTLPIPLIRITLQRNNGGELSIFITPQKAQQIGLDFISAAVASWHDVGIRLHAKEHGIDADTLIAEIRDLVDIGLEEKDDET